MIIPDAWGMLLSATLPYVMGSGMALGSRMPGEAVPVGQAVVLATLTPSLIMQAVVLPPLTPSLIMAAILPFVARVVIACGVIVPVMPGIMIASALLVSVAGSIMIARPTGFPLMGVAVPIPIPRTIIPIPVSIPRTIIPIPVPRAIIPIPVSIAEAGIPISIAVPVPSIAPQIFAVLGKPPLVFAEASFVALQLTPIFPDITIAKPPVAIGEVTATGVGTALVQRAHAVGDFIGTHPLQPVDAVGQFLPVNPLVGPRADGLAQPIAEAIGQWRVARGPKYATVLQELPGSRSQGLGVKVSTVAKNHGNCQNAESLHNLFLSVR